MINYFPKYFSDKAIQLYIVTMLVISVIFFRFTMEWYMYQFGIIAVASFFYFSNKLSTSWQKYSPKTFVKKIFYTALIIRVIWVIFSYFFYTNVTGQPYEFDAADSIGYDGYAKGILNLGYGKINEIFYGMDIADMGYGVYLGTLYKIFGSSLIVPRLIKAALGAWTAVLIYKVASRTFGEAAGRLAAIFTMLMPNLILYCGMHLKEVEMVFLAVAFVERTDILIRSRVFNFANVFPPLIISMLIFTFRTPLGLTAVFALVTAVVFSSHRILGFGQRIFIIIWVVFTIMYFIGGKITAEAERLWENRSANQSSAFEAGSVAEGGNKYMKYASASLLAPAIFIIPIPTMVNVETQRNMQMINGGNFTKEILAFFVILALIWIIKNGKWRDFTLLGSFMIGYLVVITLSAFVQSERFHQPTLPFILMFAAFGITKVEKKTKRYFLIYMAFLLLVLIAWNWVKLSGRGMI